MTRPPRPCIDCGATGNWTDGRCPQHQRAHRSKYGSRHQRNRTAWDALVQAGRCWCWRCHERIDPGTPWDLGHIPGKPSRPEHAQCNRSAGARGIT